MFVDKSADIEKSIPVIRNAKVQRPSVCNALDTLLVHEEIAPRILPLAAQDLSKAGVEIRADEKAFSLMNGYSERVCRAGDGDFGKEFLALILSVKVVRDIDEALDHIWQYSSGHSEAILTEDSETAARFVDAVDSSAVFVNASTRFNDGGQLGLGAEVAVSTQKLHARGPMGLQELTTYKWIVGDVSDGKDANYWVRS
jgi:glutamate-5-semialdehyde dehydrogenase